MCGRGRRWTSPLVRLRSLVLLVGLLRSRGTLPTTYLVGSPPSGLPANLPTVAAAVAVELRETQLHTTDQSLLRFVRSNMARFELALTAFGPRNGAR